MDTPESRRKLTLESAVNIIDRVYNLSHELLCPEELFHAASALMIADTIVTQSEARDRIKEISDKVKAAMDVKKDPPKTGGAN